MAALKNSSDNEVPRKVAIISSMSISVSASSNIPYLVVRKSPNARVQRGRVRHSDADEKLAARPLKKSPIKSFRINKGFSGFINNGA